MRTEPSNLFSDKELAMNFKKVWLLVLVVFLMTATNGSNAGSIWAKRDKNIRDAFADDVARNIGDVLTIIIYERSYLENKSNRQLKKKTTHKNNFDGKVGIDHIVPNVPAVSFGTGTEYEKTLDSYANNKDDRKFEDSISVVVIDVLPNGNLVVMGMCKRNISDDIQIIEVSGIVRPSDIAFNNTVNSKQVANLHIVSRSEGVGAQYNRPGWLSRILDVIWPF
jgi:flagellar L-ring protein precursor FlgH